MPHPTQWAKRLLQLSMSFHKSVSPQIYLGLCQEGFYKPAVEKGCQHRASAHSIAVIDRCLKERCTG